MNVLRTSLDYREPLGRAMLLAWLVGGATSILVLTLQPSGNYAVWFVGNFLGSTGNDLFLLFSNLLLIGWAWRQRLVSIVKLTLSLDLLVWLSVQGIKLLHLEPWYLRPNGGTGGFPSGHATHAFGMAFLLSLYFPRLSWLWYSCAAAIAWSRVETDWHTGLQVTAGIVLGTVLVGGLVRNWLAHPDAAVLQAQPAADRKLPFRGRQSYAAE